jgi:hypothetical protein
MVRWTSILFLPLLAFADIASQGAGCEAHLNIRRQFKAISDDLTGCVGEQSHPDYGEHGDAPYR